MRLELWKPSDGIGVVVGWNATVAGTCSLSVQGAALLADNLTTHGELAIEQADEVCRYIDAVLEGTAMVLNLTLYRSFPPAPPKPPPVEEAPKPAPKKPGRKCGNCGKTGHNKRSCKK